MFCISEQAAVNAAKSDAFVPLGSAPIAVYHTADHENYDIEFVEEVYESKISHRLTNGQTTNFIAIQNHGAGH